MTNHKYRSVSRSRTPWDDSTELSPLEAFVRSNYKSNFKSHHSSLEAETELLNSYTPEFCHVCGDIESFSKRGYTRNGVQRYWCRSCHKYFTITTGTIFQDHKISIKEWIEYLLNLFGYSSINLNSKVNKNSPTTSKYWLKKVFILLEDYQENTVLSGDVWLDEFYYDVVRKDLHYKENGKLPRGLSINKYCIGLATDGTHSYAIVEGKAKTSVPKTLKAFESHIAKESHLIHDSEHSHNSLVEKLCLKSTIHPTKETKNLSDKDNPMRKINHLCSALRSFLDSHPGFNREELQDYLNLFCFMMDRPKNKLEKVDILLEKALNTMKVIKFREYFSKKKA